VCKSVGQMSRKLRLYIHNLCTYFIYSPCPIGIHLDAINVFLDYLKIFLYITAERKNISELVSSIIARKNLCIIR